MIAIRVDANKEMATGHVIRCLINYIGDLRKVMTKYWIQYDKKIKIMIYELSIRQEYSNKIKLIVIGEGLKRLLIKCYKYIGVFSESR